MKPTRISLVLLAIPLACGVNQASANVTGVNWAAMCTALNCYNYGTLWDSSGDISIGATQTAAGKMGGAVTTDTILDPTLTVNNAIGNDTGFDWTSYVVDVFLNKSFTVAFPATPVANPSGWSAGVSIAPHFDVASGLYTAELLYTGGTPVSSNPLSPNNEFDFAYKVTFSGATSYSLTEQVSPVPEPAAFSLLLCGLVLGALKAAGGSRKTHS